MQKLKLRLHQHNVIAKPRKEMLKICENLREIN